MPIKRQISFAAGEVTPEVWGRIDQIRRETGLKICRNFAVGRHGALYNRPGTEFITVIGDSTKAARLIPWRFNNTQTYMLVFGDLTMRVIRNGAEVTETAQNITNITAANPPVVTITGHGYSNGDDVFITGVAGMTQVNGRNYRIANVTANTFELQDPADGTNINGTSWTAYSSGGTGAKIFQLTTPYAVADLPELRFAQSGDVVTITHPTYAPRELTRTGHTSWTLAIITFGPGTSKPTTCAGTAGGAGTDTYKYKVTAVDAETGKESIAGIEATQAITNITQANPAVVTITGHGFANDDTVFIDGVVGMTEVNGRTFKIANVAANTFELVDEDSSAYTAYSSGGTGARDFIEITSAAAPTSANPHNLTWDLITGAREYNIYKELNGIYGFIGVADAGSFDDIDYSIDTADTPPEERFPFRVAGDFPSVVSYYQQRRLFGNTNNRPQGVFTTRSGDAANMTTSNPSQADDALTFDLDTSEEIRHLIDVGGRLVGLTAGGEWAMLGDQAGTLTPTDINARQYGHDGANSRHPLIIGGNALFVQANQSIVRDLGYDVQVDGYRGNDLTVFSAHLVDDFTIDDWAFQKTPHSIVWMVRNDGSMLALTYLREHRLLGWSRHDFQGGTVENVASVREGDEDAVYILVKRTIDGKTRRYVERMTDRFVSDVRDHVVMDSALSSDGRNTDTTHTMTLSGGSTWDHTETLTLTSSAVYFAAGDVGSQIHLRDAAGVKIRFEIEGFTSTTVVTGKAHKTVPTTLRSTAVSTWDIARTTYAGLWHLEGEDVTVFADGFVDANKNNPAYTTITVTNGAVTLAKARAVVHVGLPITSDFETLDIDSLQVEPMIDKTKHITDVNLYVEKSRGIWAGQGVPADDTVNAANELRELKIRDDEDYDSPVALHTGPVNIPITSEITKHGRIFVRQVDPLPLTVLAAAPSGAIPVQDEEGE